MTVAAIRTALLATVAAVAEIGQVHAYERYAREEAKFRDRFLFTPSGGVEQIRGWWLRRTATRESSPSVGRTVNVHTWQVRGYMSLNDDAATELEFDALVEALRDALRANPNLGGTAEQGPLADGDNSDGPQLLDTGPVMFCGALCHSAVIELRTWSYL